MSASCCLCELMGFSGYFMELAEDFDRDMELKGSGLHGSVSDQNENDW